MHARSAGTMQDRLLMTRNFTIVAALVVVTASLAGGVRTRTSQRRITNLNAPNTNQSSTAAKYKADKIENDYHEAISTVEEKYAGDIDYEKATQLRFRGCFLTFDRTPFSSRLRKSGN